MDVKTPRNPGPWGGYGFMTVCDRYLPSWLVNAMMQTGTFIAWSLMREQRAHSRDYLETLLERSVRWRETLRHFRALADTLMVKLRAGRGERVPMQWADEENRRRGWLLEDESQPILLGTFHAGASDLLGFSLEKFDRPVCMVRQRVRNSSDIDRLLRQASSRVEIMWVNDESELIFGLRDALEADKTLALQCDRIEHASKTESFEFLGARRRFPFTIYRLALLYARPVQFCLALPEREGGGYRVHVCDPFIPQGGNRREQLRAAYVHFQEVLTWLEALLRQQPLQWFNFLPLNPVDPAA